MSRKEDELVIMTITPAQHRIGTVLFNQHSDEESVELPEMTLEGKIEMAEAINEMLVMGSVPLSAAAIRLMEELLDELLDEFF